MRAWSDRKSRSVPARMGIGLGLLLGVVAIALIVLGDTRKQVTVGVLVGAWSGVIGALAVGPSRNSRDPQLEPAGAELAVRGGGGEVELGSATAVRRDYQLQLEVMLRRELEAVLRTELSELRTEVAGLRSDLVEKVNGQLRLERIETTRVIGSDIEALQHEVRRLAGSRDTVNPIPRSLPPRVTDSLGSVMDQPSATTVRQLPSARPAGASPAAAAAAAPFTASAAARSAVLAASPPSAAPATVVPRASAPARPTPAAFPSPPVVPATPVSPATPAPPVVPATPAPPVVPATPVRPVAPATPVPPVAPATSPVATSRATPLEPVLPPWSSADLAGPVPSPRLDMFAGLPRLGRFTIDDSAEPSPPRAPSPSTLPAAAVEVDDPPSWAVPGPRPSYVGRRRIHDPAAPSGP